MTILCDKGHIVDLQIVDNESSATYKKAVALWNTAYQLFLSDGCQQNAVEQEIQTFKLYQQLC